MILKYSAEKGINGITIRSVSRIGVAAMRIMTVPAIIAFANSAMQTDMARLDPDIFFTPILKESF